jgi:release factor glutamine methyltransferase
MITPDWIQTNRDTVRTISSHCLTLRDAVSRASQILREKGIESYWLDARLIVAYCLGLDPIDIYRKPDLAIDPKRESALQSLISRRASGVPTAYVIGTKEFWSLSITVDDRVLIPRPETEFLVEESLAASRLFPEHIAILELGTGSAAVSVALGVELTGARIVSTDVSEEALAVARINVSAHALVDRISLGHGDLFYAVDPDDRFDLIVSNPPYLTDEEMNGLSPEVRSEPDRALRAGKDGLSIIRPMIAAAVTYLNPGGFLIFEIGAGQESGVRQLIARTKGLLFLRTRNDYSGHPRVVIAQRTK